MIIQYGAIYPILALISSKFEILQTEGLKGIDNLRDGIKFYSFKINIFFPYRIIERKK